MSALIVEEDCHLLSLKVFVLPPQHEDGTATIYYSGFVAAVRATAFPAALQEILQLQCEHHLSTRELFGYCTKLTVKQA